MGQSYLNWDIPVSCVTEQFNVGQSYLIWNKPVSCSLELLQLHENHSEPFGNSGVFEKSQKKILKQVEDESARRMEHSSPGSRIDQHDSFLYQDKE